MKLYDDGCISVEKYEDGCYKITVADEHCYNGIAIDFDNKVIIGYPIGNNKRSVKLKPKIACDSFMTGQEDCSDILPDDTLGTRGLKSVVLLNFSDNKED